MQSILIVETQYPQAPLCRCLFFSKEVFIWDYQLEIKQIVDYPRCRIYREFIRSLMEDKDIRTNGSSYLFYYMTLCSYDNFRSSYRRIEGISYLIGPGEWICKTSELTEWFAHVSSIRLCPFSTSCKNRTTSLTPCLEETT